MCQGCALWVFACKSLLNFIYDLFQTEWDGLTGKVKFDENGKRTDFTVDLVELTSEGLREVSHCLILESLLCL